MFKKERPFFGKNAVVGGKNVLLPTWVAELGLGRTVVHWKKTGFEWFVLKNNPSRFVSLFLSWTLLQHHISTTSQLLKPISTYTSNHHFNKLSIQKNADEKGVACRHVTDAFQSVLYANTSIETYELLTKLVESKAGGSGLGMFKLCETV